MNQQKRMLSILSMYGLTKEEAIEFFKVTSKFGVTPKEGKRITEIMKK